VFEFDGTGLKEQRKEIDFDTDDVTQVRYSPDGNYLAASTGSRRYVYLYKVEGDELKVHIKSFFLWYCHKLVCDGLL
jgi:WD40 repeat protein